MADQSLWADIVKKVGGGKSPNGGAPGGDTTNKPTPIKWNPGSDAPSGWKSGTSTIAGSPSGDTQTTPLHMKYAMGT